LKGSKGVNIMLKKKIGKRIEKIRLEMNLTKEALAKELGISGQYLGIVEKGQSALSYEKLEKLCNITGYSSDYILFGKGNKVLKNTEELLKDISIEQIEESYEIIKRLVVFIKNNNH